MTAASTLARGRALAESLMVDSCRITRPGDGDPVFNNATGQYDDPPPITVYEGKCRLQVRESNPSSADVAGASWTLQDLDLQLPVVGSEAVAEDQTVEYLTSAHDPALPGKRFRVSGLFVKTHATSRRLRVELIVGV